MTQLSQTEYDEAVLEVTAGPQWDVVKKGLANEIYACQARALDAQDWGEVCRLRGFAQGILFCMGLREQTKQAKETEAQNNADV